MVVDQRPKRPLGRPFWILLGSSAASNLADGALRIGLPLIALRYTRSPVSIGALELARSNPWLILALPVGALTDRWDRRVAMMAANALRAVAAAALAIALATGTGSFAVLVVTAVIAGAAEVVYDTAAQSILPSVVDPGLLGRANSRLAILERGTQQYLAPGLGGFLVGASIVAAASAPMLFWLIAALALLALRGQYRPGRQLERTTLLTEVMQGLSFVWHRPALRTLAAMVGIGNLAASATFTVMVLYAVGAESAMGLSDAAYGTMLLLSGVGAIGGALVSERLVERLGQARTIRWSTPVLLLFSLGPALSADPRIVGAALIVGSFANMTFNIPSVSYRQRVTPGELLGRVNSTFRLVGWGTMPLGALLGGLIGEVFSIRTVFVVSTALAALLIVLVQRIRDEHMSDVAPSSH